MTKRTALAWADDPPAHGHTIVLTRRRPPTVGVPPEWTRIGHVLRGCSATGREQHPSVAANAKSDRRRAGAAGDRGSATVCVAAVCMVVLTFGLTGLVAAGAVTARHRAQAAADLGALAGAPWTVVLPDRACATAAAVVAANGATLAGCRIDGVDVVVTATVPVTGAPPGTGPATATARAGPQQESGR